MDKTGYNLQDENRGPVWGPCIPKDLEGSNQCNRKEDNQRTEGSATETHVMSSGLKHGEQSGSPFCHSVNVTQHKVEQVLK